MEHLLEGSILLRNVSKAGLQRHEGPFPAVTNRAHAGDMVRFSLKMEGQDFFPKGLDVSKNTILHKEYISVEILILHIENKNMLQQ